MNSDTVEQTKQQIRGLVSEIAQLSRSNLSAEEYYEAFLQRIVQALAAVGGAIWLVGESRRPELTYQISISETLLDTGSSEAQRHLRLLDTTLRASEPRLIPPLSGVADDQAGGNPTHYLLVLAPLRVDGRVEGLVEIFQRPDSQPATQRGYLRFLVQMCELAGEWLKSRKLRQFSDRHNLWAQADQFSRLVHESLDLRETAYTVTNEGRRIIGCDRVSVAIMRNGRCTVEAVSGQDTIENRSNIIAALNRLATRVAATGEPLWFEGVTDDLPPQVEEAVDAYVDESYAKTVTVLPLRRPESGTAPLPETAADEARREGNAHQKVIGALIIEQIETDLPRALIAPRIDLVYEHSSRAISNSLTHNDLFLMPLWRAIGHSSWMVQARTLPKTLTIGTLLLVVLIGMFVVPWQFKMKSPGTLQPKIRREVFVRTEGIVDQVLVKDDQPVTQGQVLVVLKNQDLLIRMDEVEGELERLVPELNGLRRQRSQGLLSPAERVQVSSRIDQIEGRLLTLDEQKKLLQEMIDGLTIKSPIDGIALIPWEVERSLQQLPVTPGQPLLTVADPSGEWELELEVPERRVMHILKAQQELSRQDLEVSYVLKTDPKRELRGTLGRIHNASEVAGEEGPVVRMLVDIETDELVKPFPGASATANVHCGWRPVGYAWFHEAIEWVQLNLLF